MSYFTIVLISLLASALFSGMEIAFVSANKLRFELDKKQGRFPWKIIEVFTNNPSQYISTMLIGNNIALVIYGAIMAEALEPWIKNYVESDGSILLIQTLISTLIILFLAEFLPKSLFRIDPNKTIRIFALPTFFFYIIFYPIARFTTGLSRRIIQVLFRVKITDQKENSFGKTDLNHLVYENTQLDDEDNELEHDVKIFQNALDFSTIKLRECVVPRTELVAVSIDDDVSKLNELFIETGHSKILVYQDSIDNIIGYAHCITLFKKPVSIKSIVRKLPIVPETMPANKLLANFTQNKKSMALVVDEFGGTSGIVTMEDILEEIIGDIQDEHDKDTLESKRISESEYQFSGRMEIDDINEDYNLNLQVSDEYETVAGLILAHHGSIPKVNDLVEFEQFKFKILKVSTTKIELVHLKV